MIDEQPPDLEGRVANLERMARDYSNKVQAGDRLSLGVERLAEETGGLNAVLTKVDEQQQRLSNLGRDLERVEEQSAKKEDVKKTAQTLTQGQEDFRQGVIRRGVMTGVGIVVLLLVIAAGLSENDRRNKENVLRICKERNQASALVGQYIMEQTQIELSNKFIDDELRAKRIASLKNLQRGFIIVDCNQDGVRE